MKKRFSLLLERAVSMASSTIQKTKNSEQLPALAVLITTAIVLPVSIFMFVPAPGSSRQLDDDKVRSDSASPSKPLMTSTDLSHESLLNEIRHPTSGQNRIVKGDRHGQCDQPDAGRLRPADRERPRALAGRGQGRRHPTAIARVGGVS